MSLDYKFNNRIESGVSVESLIRDATIARVVDIILYDTHPDYDKLGKLDSIGLIKYYKLGNRQTTPLHISFLNGLTRRFPPRGRRRFPDRHASSTASPCHGHQTRYR